MNSYYKFFRIFPAIGLFILFSLNALSQDWNSFSLGNGRSGRLALDTDSMIHMCYKNREYWEEGGGELVYVTNQSECWETDTISTNGNVVFADLAVDTTNTVHLCYAECGSGGFPYYIRYRTQTNGSWSQTETLEENDNGVWGLTIRTDPDNNVHIGYMEKYGIAFSAPVRYVTNKSGDWESETLTFQGYDHCSMEVDENGCVHFAIYVMGQSMGGPVYITNAPNGNWQNPEAIESDWMGGQMEGMFIDIELDTAQNPHLFYVGAASEKNRQDHKHAVRKGNSWDIDVVELGDFVSAGNSIFIDKYNTVHLAYYKYDAGELHYANNSSGSWVFQTVDDCGAYWAWMCDMVKDSENNLHLIYDCDNGKIRYTSTQDFPAISVSPDFLDFGIVNLDRSKTKSIILSNTGEGELHICDASIQGKNSECFSVSSECDVITSGDSCIMNITFKPKSMTEKEATLVIRNSDKVNPRISIQLRGKCIPFKDWAYSYGGEKSDKFHKVRPTSDGGYVACGETNSFALDTTGLWVVKFDLDGQIIWQNIYHTPNADPLHKESAFDIQQTKDGGYVVVGYRNNRTLSGGRDGYVLKLNATGDIEWQKYYTWELEHVEGEDIFYSVIQTPDNGYALTGVYVDRAGTGGTHVDSDFWTLKLDSLGNIEWQKRHGLHAVQYQNQYYYNWERPHSIIPSFDGGYLMAGVTSFGEYNMDKSFINRTNDGNYILASTTNNALLVKLSSDGSLEWDYEYEAEQIDRNDIWILKLNPQGDILWQKTYGNWDYETASAIEQTEDGGFIIAAKTDSFDLYKRNKGDAWVFKLDKNGNIEWEYTYGGTYNDVITHIQQTADMGYIASGYTNSFGTGEPGTVSYEAWLLKLDSLGNISGCPGELMKSSNEYVSETNIMKKDYERAGETPVPETTPVDPAEENAVLTVSEAIPKVICLDPTQDSDNDGMSDQEEFGPDGNNTRYDGNSDGTPDSQQDNVTSCHTYDSENYVTLACPEGVALIDVLTRDNPNPSTSPPDVDFGFGFFEFEIHGLSAGDSTQLTLYLPDESTQNIYYKYGPSPDNASAHWYSFLYENHTGAEFETGYIILHFKDGARGDEDLIANGIIIDLGGPGYVEESSAIENITSHSSKILTFNYPNPFTASTSICFKLGKAANVKIEIYDILGHKVQTITKSLLPQGYHEIEFFPNNLPGGIYFYFLKAGDYYDIQKMIIQK
ncbi:MAG: choice-of-anchor U domain-containing protein [Bacteroidales bacterium]